MVWAQNEDRAKKRTENAGTSRRVEQGSMGSRSWLKHTQLTPRWGCGSNLGHVSSGPNGPVVVVPESYHKAGKAKAMLDEPDGSISEVERVALTRDHSVESIRQ